MKKKLIIFLALACLAVLGTLAVLLLEKSPLAGRRRPSGIQPGVELSPVEGVSIVRLMVPGSGSRTGSRRSSGSGDGKYFTRMENYTLLGALEHLESRRVLEINPLPGGNYNISVEVEQGGEQQARSILRKAFEEVFEVKIRDKSRPMEVLVLECPGGRLQGALPSTASGRISRGTMNNQLSLTASCDMKGFAELLEEHLGKIVLDETGIQGVYEIRLDWDVSRPESFTEALEKRGLELRPEERKIEGVFIEKSGWSW